MVPSIHSEQIEEDLYSACFPSMLKMPIEGISGIMKLVGEYAGERTLYSSLY